MTKEQILNNYEHNDVHFCFTAGQVLDAMEVYANQRVQEAVLDERNRCIEDYRSMLAYKNEEIERIQSKPAPDTVGEGFEKWLLDNRWRKLDDKNYAHEYRSWGGFPICKKTEDLYAEYLKTSPPAPDKWPTFGEIINECNKTSSLMSVDGHKAACLIGFKAAINWIKEITTQK